KLTNASHHLHPNPAITTITLSGTEEGSTATITNIHGQVVQQFAIHAAQQTIDIESLPSGFYFCTLQNGQRRQVLRFVRE
ncbi:MAG: T9SS type A sorting domain-containing protein, partial [Bacteroidetes bacterium]|nr:T9SS type A sorting domain-containing protein [Bacteroidota bacterium]